LPAIGVFDSGVGGLTVVRELVRALPGQDLVFLGDTARVPYGTRGREVIRRFAIELAGFLTARGVSHLVAACNTISSTCLEELQSSFTVPLFGVVEPAVREATNLTRSGRVGVIGTRATVSSGVYEARLLALDDSLRVFTQACPLFVPLAEEGMLDSKAARLIAEDYLGGLREQEIDVLILGCTHYPLLRDVIQGAVGPSVRLIDSAKPLAEELARALPAPDTHRQATYDLYVTDAPERVTEVAASFFGGELPAPLRKVTLG
jgi:glutamate racemase